MLPTKSISRKISLKIQLFLLLIVTTTLLCLCFSFGQTELLIANSLPVSRANNSNPWQYASFPVEKFQAYTSGYGYRISPKTGALEFHYGLDIAAPYGSYVRNWWSGRVVELSDNTACGTMIKIESGPWQHIYCHLIGKVEEASNGQRYLIDQEGKIMLALNQDVRFSSRIARVGVSGNTTGPHLHWALKYQGKFLDPGLVIRAMYQQQTEKG